MGIMVIRTTDPGLQSNKFVKKAGIAFLLLFISVSCSEKKVSDQAIYYTPAYYCSGEHSRCYHLDSLCVAFNRCSGLRIEIPLDSAVVRFKPCGFCVLKNDTIEKKHKIREDSNLIEKSKSVKNQHQIKHKIPIRDMLNERARR